MEEKRYIYKEAGETSEMESTTNKNRRSIRYRKGEEGKRSH